LFNRCAGCCSWPKPSGGCGGCRLHQRARYPFGCSAFEPHRSSCRRRRAGALHHILIDLYIYTYMKIYIYICICIHLFIGVTRARYPFGCIAIEPHRPFRRCRHAGALHHILIDLYIYTYMNIYIYICTRIYLFIGVARARYPFGCIAIEPHRPFRRCRHAGALHHILIDLYIYTYTNIYIYIYVYVFVYLLG